MCQGVWQQQLLHHHSLLLLHQLALQFNHFLQHHHLFNHLMFHQLIPLLRHAVILFLHQLQLLITQPYQTDQNFPTQALFSIMNMFKSAWIVQKNLCLKTMKHMSKWMTSCYNIISTWAFDCWLFSMVSLWAWQSTTGGGCKCIRSNILLTLTHSVWQYMAFYHYWVQLNNF